MIDTALLADLIDRLHEANCRLSDAARPLDRLSELSPEQRKQLGDQLRAAQQDWEIVTKRISQAMAQGNLQKGTGQKLELSGGGTTKFHGSFMVGA